MGKFKAGDTIVATRDTYNNADMEDVPEGTTFEVTRVEPADYTGSWDTEVATSGEYGTLWVASADFELAVSTPTEVTRETIGGVHYTDLQEEDIIGYRAGEYFTVNRPVVKDDEPEPEPGTLLAFDDGSYGFRVREGYAEGNSEWRLLYNDGSTGLYDWDFVKRNRTLKEDA